jgi:pimeloyl-ACP methyl ester carboxylesterase
MGFPRMYQTLQVTSSDGTTIGCRQLGHGPGLVLVHGSMMASQNFMSLAEHLADDFTLYIPDRRGRGMSGTFGEDYTINKEVDDLHALLRKTSARSVFGLSSGAIVSLQAALKLSEIHKVALYEPPLSFDDSPSTSWVPRYESEISQGKLAAAFVTVIKGTGDSPILKIVPRFLLVPLMGLALKGDAKSVGDGDVPLVELVPTMHFDARVVMDVAGGLEHFRAIQAEVLLLGGRRSASYLHTALDRLSAVLPQSTRVELSGVGHLAADNGGKPQLVASVLRRFFAEGS